MKPLPNIKVNGEVLDYVNKLTYLGSTLSIKLSLAMKSSAKSPRTPVSLGGFKPTLRSISLSTKFKVYQAIINYTHQYL